MLTTLFTHDYLNRLQIGFVVKQLESGLIASPFIHSLANQLRLNNCDIVGGVSCTSLHKRCGSVACMFVGKNKQSRQGRLLKFRLERAKHFLVFFLLVAYVVGRYFVAEQGIQASYLHTL